MTSSSSSPRPVGKPSKWREVARFTDSDTMQFTLYGEKEGKWASVHSGTLRRKPVGGGPDQVVTEGVVEAPVEEVWAALVTKEGLESWNVAHADVDLKVGGKMLTHYDPKGQTRRSRHHREHHPQLRAQADAVDQGGDTARRSSPSRTRSRPCGKSSTSSPSAQRARGSRSSAWATAPTRNRRSSADFFEKGNAYTLKKLQEKFAAKGTPSAAKG